jgi:hypothetical protein
MSCARKYFYEYVLGWRLDVPNVHLVAGHAVHIAMEHLLRCLSRDGSFTPAHVDEAFGLFLADYRVHFVEADDALRAPKDPESVRWALDEYIKYYQLDRFEVLHTEIGGAVPLTEDGHYVYFNIDALVRDHGDGGAIKVLDHKTCKMFPRGWAQQWLLSVQFGVYTHAMRCIFGDDFWGVVINGIKLSAQPRIAANGKVYKQDEDKAPGFQRANVRYSEGALEGWYFDVLHWHTLMRRDFEALCDAKPGDLIMRAFPRNYKACGSYGGCPYFSLCWARDNPLQHASEPPAGFRREFWNPADRANEGKALLTYDPATHTGRITEVEAAP